MLNLKHYASLAEDRIITDDDRARFKTVGFDPNELHQLKDMNKKELQLLMLFCGIRVFNGIPLLVLEEDEMRMAYVIWRASMIAEKKDEVTSKLKRGIQWATHLTEAARIWSRSM